MLEARKAPKEDAPRRHLSHISCERGVSLDVRTHSNDGYEHAAESYTISDDPPKVLTHLNREPLTSRMRNQL